MSRKIIAQYLSVLIFHSLGSSMIASTYVTYLASHGLNLFEVNLVNFVFFLTLFSAEIPTGAFADICGRKTSYIVSCFTIALGAGLYACMNNFWGFIMSECIIAIGMTFASGAFQAWLVDSLKHHEFVGDRQKVFAQAQIWPKLGNITGAIIGAHCASFDLRLPWIIYSCMAIIEGFIVLFWLREDYFEKKKFSFGLNLEAMKETIRQSITYGARNKSIRFLLAIGIVQTLCLQAPNMQWQPFFINHGVTTAELGHIFALMMVGLMGGSYLAQHLTMSIKDEKKALIFCQIFTGSLIILSIVCSFPAAACMFILHEVPRGMYGPVKEKFLHDNIPSHARATISSFESMTPHLGSMIGLLGSGLLAQMFGIPITWICSGGVLIVCTLCIGRVTRRR